MGVSVCVCVCVCLLLLFFFVLDILASVLIPIVRSVGTRVGVVVVKE
jgi:hypothetical protein